MLSSIGAAPALDPGTGAGGASAPKIARTPAVKGVSALPSRFEKPENQADRQFRPTRAAFPKAAAATVRIAPSGGAAELAAPSGVPVTIAGGAGYTGPSAVDVAVQDRGAADRAGVNGVLFSVTSRDGGTGRARVSLDYSSFAEAFGGGYGARLRLVQLPACALTTPERAECLTQTPLRSANDGAAKSVSAEVRLDGVGKGSGGAVPASLTQPAAAAGAPVVLAALAGAGDDGGGASGSYGATSLAASGSWSAGSSSGSFGYSYPITVPPSASSLAPKVALGYDSGSVDGQTAASDAQSSWIGDGWGMAESFIERSFVPCSDNPGGTASPAATSDNCYNGEILTLSLNGATTSLVWDAAKQVYKPAEDSGEVVKHVTGSGNGSGTYNTDYWTVTDRTGTVFSFGLNHLPGWSSGKAATNSVDWLPVYSAHAGDPCYNAAGFSASVCTMGRRWNLDYVKDLHGNAMSYYYKQDVNNYGANNATAPTAYVRDSHVDHVDYGFTDGNAYGTVPDRVDFATGDRCVTSPCSPLNTTTKANWPDVPYDLICTSSPCQVHSPSFFSTVRLTSITTRQYSPATSAYQPVDSWALDQTMPPAGDGGATLWLSSITRTGSDGRGTGSATPLTMPSVSFGGTGLQNRVDTTADGLPALYRFRINSVTNETGSVTGVQYYQPSPCTAPVKLDPAANTSSCYPVSWTPSGYLAPITDWFNKYAVQKVTQSDPTGGAPVQASSYEYEQAAWHYDDNELVRAKYRTYGQWRGFGTVTSYTGDGVNDRQTMGRTVFHQGMSRNNGGAAVLLTDSQGGRHEDLPELQGRTLESTAYTGKGGSVDHSAITSYWVSPATASRERSGLPTLTATTVKPVESWSRQAITGAGGTTWRSTQTDTSYDGTVSSPTFGLVTAVYSHTVPADPAYDRCVTTGYAPVNTALNLVGLVSATETDSVACAGFTQGSPASVPGSVNTLTAPASVNRPDQVVSAGRTFYDAPATAATWPQPAGPAFPQANVPTLGDVSVLQTATGATGGNLTYTTTSTQVYDGIGRPTDSYNAKGARTSTAFTADSAGSLTGITTTNALGQTGSTVLDPARGTTLTATDANGVQTTKQYDTLGRLTGVWLASRPTSAPANLVYEYTISRTGVTAVTSKKLNDELQYQVSTQIYDAMMRPRQTQTPTPQGGRMVSDAFYDTHGWVSAKYNGWWDDSTLPNTTPVSAADLKKQVPNQDFYGYDGLGRVVLDDSEQNGVVVSSTRTVYNGDRVTVIPPTGGTTSATTIDPMGRTVQLTEYTSAPTLTAPADRFTGSWTVSGGTSQSIAYGYDNRGNRTTVTAGGSTWTTSYDLLGRATAKDDPDAGHSQTRYDAVGLVLEATDSRGKTVSFAYDALGRQTGSYAAPAAAQSAANQLSALVYDNSNNAVAGMKYPVGHLTTATSFNNGAAYTVQEKNFNVFGSSMGQTVTIPSAAEGSTLGTTYTFQHTYTANTGLPLKDVYPAGAGLPAETVTHGYAGNLDLPDTLGGTNGYAQGVEHDAYGRVLRATLGSGANEAWITNQYDPHTGRLTDQLVTRSTATPTNVDEQAYSYDLAGNLTRQTSTRLGSAGTVETQCYRYDALDRLTKAWTATDTCAATPTTAAHATVGDGIAGGAYWTEWSLDALGNRTQQVEHSTTGGADTTTGYTYDGNGTHQPHTLTAAGAGTSYQYDPAGNTVRRTTPSGGTQNLNWDDAGRLGSITGGTAGTTSYVYDASGAVLLQKDPGTTVLYLPGQQLSLTGGVLSGTRYYPLPGGGTAVRTGTTGGATGYTFEITDQHGTAGLALDSTAQNPTWRQFTPYGAPRGTTVGWADNRGFLNAPTDTDTGLTTLGARQYDPTTGRFVSLDPLFEAARSQLLNGYGYTAANPIGQADPSGLIPDGCGTEGACYGYNPNNGGCPGGCGSTANQVWGASQGLTPNNGGGCKPGACGTAKPPLSVWDVTAIRRTMQEYWDYTHKKHCSGVGRGTTCRTQEQIDRDNAANQHMRSRIADTAGTFANMLAHGTEAAAGAIGTVGGGTLAASGVAECGTGVLCPVGALSVAGGLAIAVPSAELAVHGARGLGDDIHTLLNQADSGGGLDITVEREMELVRMVKNAEAEGGNALAGEVTPEEAQAVGEAWVGPGFRESDRTPGLLISADGLRQYRPAAWKPSRPAQYGGPTWQANLEYRFEKQSDKAMQGDIHLNVTGLGGAP
ncbi:sugar-binding protein [Kitasatospora sp. CB02891]|nr:sugar-binding protein [Kitasatospora sp. CB02891]